VPDAQPDLSGAPIALGIYGKMPAHGDFVRRGLPSSFVTPWDAWLAAGVAAAREQLAEGFAQVWDDAPAWRFALPAGVCGPDAVAGVMLPSEDTVGRRFPLTAAALLPPGVVAEEAWFDRLEAAVRAARHGSIDADGMIRAMQTSAELEPEAPAGDVLGLLGGGMAAAPLAAGPTDSGAQSWGAAVPLDPMEGPAAGAEDMWGALLGDTRAEAPPTEDAMEGPAASAAGAAPMASADAVAPPVGEDQWSALLGDAPLGAASEAAMPGAGDMWGNLLGDGTLTEASAMPEPIAGVETSPSLAEEVGQPGAAAWDDLLGEGPDSHAPDDVGTATPPGVEGDDGTLAVTPVEPEIDEEPVPSVGGEHSSGIQPGATEGMEALSGAAAASAAMAAAITSDRVTGDITLSDDAPPHAPAPPRPEHGGWWTRGGARQAPMVWPLPELPPAESFVLLLHNQDPESGA